MKPEALPMRVCSKFSPSDFFLMMMMKTLIFLLFSFPFPFPFDYRFFVVVHVSIFLEYVKESLEVVSLGEKNSLAYFFFNFFFWIHFKFLVAPRIKFCTQF